MDEGQKNRRIGRGMKPRGNQRVKPQKEKKPMSEKSTTEGQPEVELEHVLGSKEGNETPRNLEAKNEPESLQNLESSAAQDSDLEAALNESEGPEEPKGILVAHIADPNPPSFSGGKMAPAIIHAGEFNTDRPFDQLQPPLGGATFPAIGLQPNSGGFARISADGKYSIGVDYGMGRGKSMLAVVRRGDDKIPDELLATFGVVSIGPQPDGSEKFVISVQEGYTDAVRQWAEADGVPVERWLSDRLYEYISTYGEPAKGR